MAIQIKRVYAQPSREDGMRVLVDRLWPRGLSKEKAKIDLWLKEIAPSTALRQWFAHDPNKWAAFKQRYRAELAANDAPLQRLKQAMAQGPVTLIYSAKETEQNNAIVLLEYLSS